jgi:hypothetical protein
MACAPGDVFVNATGREAHAQEDVFERREAGQEIERLKNVTDVIGPKAIAAMFR